MNRKRVLLIGVGILAILVLIYVLVQCSEIQEQNRDDMERDGRYESDVHSDAWSEEIEDIEYQGNTYEYNYDVHNYLFIGADNTGKMIERQNGHAGQSDTLILVSVNVKTHKMHILEISRDTLVDVKVLDQTGEQLGYETMQIGGQFAYGDGLDESCKLTRDAVAELLYGIRIDAYVALGIDGIGEITTLMGGVNVTVPEDYTSIEPVFEKGATVNLQGELAERYVRSRDTSKVGSNNLRMERQTHFIEALAEQLKGNNVQWYQDLWEDASDYIVTDISTKDMDRIVSCMDVTEILTVPGEVRKGTGMSEFAEEPDEFIVDNDELQKIIIKLFYKLK